MRTSYKTLTSDEYNVLNVISSRTKNDCWFWLKQDKQGVDYVWDLEEGKRMCLKTGVGLLVEGLDCKENYDNCWLNCFENLTFRNLLKKLNIEFDITYDGPEIMGMPKQKFIEYCKDNNIKFKKYGDEFLVGDMIYQFDRYEKCFGFVALNLDESMRLESRTLMNDKKPSLNEKIQSASSVASSRLAEQTKNKDFEL